MNDEVDTREDETPDEESGGPIGGERLALARRELQIPLLEIAKELHLDEYKVRALENNEFDVIGAPVFAKGHLRKYAQLVKVDEADVMADYYQLNRSGGAPPLLSPRPRPRQTISPGPWIVVILLLVASATAWWWYSNREPAAEAPVTGEIAALPDSPEAAMDEADNADSGEPVELLDDESLPEPETEATPPPPVADAIDPSGMRLSIHYSGDSWTEITDANGSRLFFDLGKAGRTVNVSGAAPFNVLFGDADNVGLEVNGNTFNIPAAARRGKTARLTIIEQ